MSLKAKIIILFIIAIIGGALAWFFFGGIDCIALKVDRTDAVKGVTVTGIVRSVEDVDITTEATGIIQKIFISTGADVEKGQVLAVLDKQEILGEFKAAQARIEAAQSRLSRNIIEYEDAIQDEERYEKLYRVGAVSKRQVEERTLRRQSLEEQMQEDRRQIEATRGELAAVQGRLENYTITAPVTGIITEKFVSTGDLVSPQQPLFRLVSPADIYLSTDVEEDELDIIQPGQNALVIFDAYPDRVFTEQVFYISRQVNPLTGTFEARITRPKETEMKILVGMTLDATIIQQQFNNVMIIPSDFILEEGNKTYVFKQANSFADKTEIKTKMFDNNRVLIEEGLKEGEVILKRVDEGKLKDGTKIKIKEVRGE